MSAEIHFDVRAGLVDQAIAWPQALLEDEARDYISDQQSRLPTKWFSLIHPARAEALTQEINHKITTKITTTGEDIEGVEQIIETNRNNNLVLKAYFDRDFVKNPHYFDIHMETVYGTNRLAEQEWIMTNKILTSAMRLYHRSQPGTQYNIDLFDSSLPRRQRSAKTITHILGQLGFSSTEVTDQLNENMERSTDASTTHASIYPIGFTAGPTSLSAELDGFFVQDEQSYTVFYEQSGPDVKIDLLVAVKGDDQGS